MKIKGIKSISTITALFAVALVLTVVGIIGVPLHMPDNDHYIIRIDSESGNHFVSEQDVANIIEGLKFEERETNKLSNIELRKIESALKQIDFVQEAQVSRDLKGNLIIEIKQDSPVARVFPDKGKGAYIGSDFNLIGLSESYAARVLLITGSGADTLLTEGFFESELGQEMGELIQFIDQEDFWKAQIVQLDIDENLNIALYPQVGKQVFEIGKVTGFQEKFEKVRIFYDEIVPKRGWGTYSVVKVQFDGQIVCR